MKRTNDLDATLCPTGLTGDFIARLGTLGVPRRIALLVASCPSSNGACLGLRDTGHSAIVYGREWNALFFKADDAERLVYAATCRNRKIGTRLRAIDLAPCLTWLCRMAGEADAADSN